MAKNKTVINPKSLDSAIRRVINGDIKTFERNFMADKEEKVPAGSVVSEVSSFGTPSTHEDPKNPDAKGIAQAPTQRQADRFEEDQKHADVEVSRVDEERAKEEAAVAKVAEASQAAYAADSAAKSRAREDAVK